MCNETIQIFYCGCIPFAPRVKHCKEYKAGRPCEPTRARKWLYIDCPDHEKDSESSTPNATTRAVQSLLSEVEKAKAAEAAEVSKPTKKVKNTGAAGANKPTKPKRIETMEEVIERGRLYVRKMSAEKKMASEAAKVTRANAAKVKSTRKESERTSAGYWTQEDDDHMKKVRRGSKKCTVM